MNDFNANDINYLSNTIYAKPTRNISIFNNIYVSLLSEPGQTNLKVFRHCVRVEVIIIIKDRTQLILMYLKKCVRRNIL